MADFPTTIYAPRTKENRSAVVYDPTQTKRIYAEDLQKLDAEVVAIEEFLGAGQLPFNNGISTHNVATTGVQNIAHGLGRVPKKIRITWSMTDQTEFNWSGVGVYNGVTQSLIVHTFYSNYAMDDSGSLAISGKVVHFENGPGTKQCYATVSFDSTNIILTWSKVGLPTGYIQMMWEAE